MTTTPERSGPGSVGALPEARSFNRRDANPTAQTVGRPAAHTSSRPMDALLPRLEGARRSGKGWIARCPAHDDRTASLTVAEGDDARVLLRCFAGCHVSAVVQAVGLTLSDLFPERVRDLSPLGRQQRREAAMAASWAAALGVLCREASIVEIAAHDLAEGKPLGEADHARLVTACARIREVQEVLTWSR